MRSRKIKSGKYTVRRLVKIIKAKTGQTEPGIERALSLEQRTLKTAMAKGCRKDPALIPLLRRVAAFPNMILNIADNNYKQEAVVYNVLVQSVAVDAAKRLALEYKA